MSNTLTAISGKAGSGKSFLSLVCALNLTESRKYDRILILFNPTKTRGANDMGYYTGDAIEKALQSNIGNMLASKFVDKSVLIDKIKDGKIELISMADARGIETRDSDILYITEAQNTSVDLMKLCLTRAKEGCKVIIEGDYSSQVDSHYFEDENNGMSAIIEKLKGASLFGCVELEDVHRSELAKLIENL